MAEIELHLTRASWWAWAVSAVYPVFGGLQVIAGAITEICTPTGKQLPDSIKPVVILSVAVVGVVVYFAALMRPSRLLFACLFLVGLAAFAFVGREAIKEPSAGAAFFVGNAAIFLVVSLACVAQKHEPNRHLT
ncbi:MAG: hypothetical protein WC538_19780 [Thermoanaerobaculia bacterium]|jgi:hypothetical protein